jgi:hypothetical protein
MVKSHNPFGKRDRCATLVRARRLGRKPRWARVDDQAGDGDGVSGTDVGRHGYFAVFFACG